MNSYSVLAERHRHAVNYTGRRKDAESVQRQLFYRSWRTIRVYAQSPLNFCHVDYDTVCFWSRRVGDITRGLNLPTAVELDRLKSSLELSVKRFDAAETLMLQKSNDTYLQKKYGEARYCSEKIISLVHQYAALLHTHRNSQESL